MRWNTAAVKYDGVENGVNRSGRDTVKRIVWNGVKTAVKDDVKTIVKYETA